MYNVRQGANSALLKIHISQHTSRLLIKQQKHFATSLKRRKRPVQMYPKMRNLTRESKLSLWPDSKFGSISSCAGFSTLCALCIAALPMVDIQRNPETFKKHCSFEFPFLGPTVKHHTILKVYTTSPLHNLCISSAANYWVLMLLLHS